MMKRLFGADGIRGNIDQYPFRSEDQLKLGRSLAQWWLRQFTDPVILIGTDTRESNQRIKVALVDGLTRAGVEIWDTGIIPTAAISFLVASNPDLAGGVIISASHNPIHENGIKVFDNHGMKINDEQEKEIEDNFFLDKEIAVFPKQSNRGYVHQVKGSLEHYAQGLVNEFKEIGWRKDKILVDCANGAAYLTAQTVLSKLGLHYVIQNFNPDGTNINFSVGSEHIRKHPQVFADEIKKSGAELGIAFDGDADRVVFVDWNGGFYDGDMLLTIAAFALRDSNALKENEIVITQMSNSGLANHLQACGIKTRKVQNGDKYITDVLVADNLTLGGEQIGHLIIHTDPYHVTGDGLRSALWILATLSQNPGATLHDLMHGLKKWPQVNISVGLGGHMLSKSHQIPGLVELKQRISDEIRDLSCFECRPASTEPVYRIMLEAKETPVHILTQYGLKLAHHIQEKLNIAGETIDILDCVSGGMIDPALSGFREEAH